jgi:succinoglycan biosynthesis protein ExoO
VSRPQVSFAIASYNSGPFLREAVESALAQRGVDVEVLIVDDHSTDGSERLAQDLAAADARVAFHRTPRNSGPGGARNVALDHARGDWFAILDSDDLLHPDRSARLLAEAEASGADMIADDLLLFDDDRTALCRLFLEQDRARTTQWIELPAYLDETRMYGKHPNLGFLKPMIRRPFLADHAIRYDEDLRVAEDDALILACLGAGARYRLLPQPLYFYRKHGSSITHRLQPAHIDRMKAASERLLAAPALARPATRRPLLRRAAAMRRAWAFTHLIDALQRREIGRAVGLIAGHPGALPLMRMPIGGLWRKLARRRSPEAALPPDRRAVLFLAGELRDEAMARLAGLAGQARDAGRVPHLFLSAAAWRSDDLLALANRSLQSPGAVVVNRADEVALVPYLLGSDFRLFVFDSESDDAPSGFASWLTDPVA